jgi:hypothetical protein
MTNKLYAISVVTGQVFPIEEEDVKTLYNYQIPLKKIPSHNCKKCYGRGYIGTDPKNGLHYLCNCIGKCIMDGYDPTKQLQIEMPRMLS